MPIEIFQWRLVSLTAAHLFSNATILIHFSVRGLLKLFVIFPCHIIFLIIIVLHLLLCGVLNLTSLFKSFLCIYKFHILYWFLLTNYLFHFWICELQVILSGDVELNPGPKPNSSQNFSICHWNLNSIPALNFSKISLFSAYNSLHKFDIIWNISRFQYSSAGPKLRNAGVYFNSSRPPIKCQTRGSLCLM